MRSCEKDRQKDKLIIGKKLGEIFANHICDKELVSRIEKQLSKLNRKKYTIQLEEKREKIFH